jgi:formylglycine-generating enzyme required for sulfatase activity
MRRSFQLASILLLVAAVCCSGCQPTPPAKHVTNSIGLKLTHIPPGSFTMGAATGEPGAKPTEKQHKVTISKGFYMGIHEVTQDQYLRVMGKNPSIFQGEMLLKNKKIVETMEPGVVGYNHPVDHVTWDDAVEFCKRISEPHPQSFELLIKNTSHIPDSQILRINAAISSKPGMFLLSFPVSNSRVADYVPDVWESL